MNIFKSLVLLAAGAALGASVVPAPAKADAVADFYKGKVVTMWVGYTTGGGYDVYARTIARHIGRHIPGNPKIVVKNRPGAGSMLLANEMANILPKDGTAIGTFSRGIFMEPLMGAKPEQAKYKPDGFTAIGSANNEVSVCASWHTSGVKTFEDLQTRGMIAGGTGPGADTDNFPIVLNNVLGTKISLVTGYPGGNDVLLAMERGEVEGRCGYSWSSVRSVKAQWLKDKKINILVQMSTQKHAEIPQIPLIMDLAKTDRDKKVLELIVARMEWGRPFVAPPGIPADRAKALQDAFMATLADPKFLAEANKAKLEIVAVSGPRVQSLIRSIAAAPKDIIQAAIDAQTVMAKINVKQIKVEKKKK